MLGTLNVLFLLLQGFVRDHWTYYAVLLPCVSTSVLTWLKHLLPRALFICVYWLITSSFLIYTVILQDRNLITFLVGWVTATKKTCVIMSDIKWRGSRHFQQNSRPFLAHSSTFRYWGSFASFQTLAVPSGESWNVLIAGPPSWGFDVLLATALFKNLPAEV